MQFLTALAKAVLFRVPAKDICAQSFWRLYPELLPLSVRARRLFLAHVVCFLLRPMLASQILPSHICRRVINVTFLHQRIIKCQVLPWQRNVMAESQWRGGGLVRVEESPGGKACWEGSMAHLTPACPLLNQARPLTHSPPGNEVVQLLEMSVHSQMQPLVVICWRATRKGGDKSWLLTPLDYILCLHIKISCLESCL